MFKELESNKNYSYRDQITRAGLSISSNIAEGFERKSKKECLNFLSFARGSCGELRSQIYIGIEINIIDRKTGHRWIKETREISKMLTGLIKTRSNFIESDNSPKS